MKVLVFPCGSEIGLELFRSLRYSIHVDLWGGSSVDDHGKAVYENYIGGLPDVDSKDFITAINKVIKDYNFDYIFPAHDSVVLALAEASARNELGCRVVTSPIETCAIARSKRKTYGALAGKIRVPLEFTKDKPPTTFPVFLKPDVGQGSKGTKLIKSHEELNEKDLSSSSYIIAEYLPGEEYTVDCFTNRSGKLLYSQARTRARTSNGISVNSSSTQGEEFLEIAQAINNTLEFRGAWFFQLKRNSNDKLVLLEIATRIAGTSGLSRALGINLPLLTLFDAEGLEVNIVKNDYQATIDRALYNAYSISMSYDYVYIDFDDLIVRNGVVNLKAIEFIYQCQNNNIPVALLTKHAEDIYQTLEAVKISTSLFSDIITIDSKDDKHKYIVHKKNAIFIDDSFAERSYVHKNIGIPTFDAHMFEVLLEPYRSDII